MRYRLRDGLHYCVAGTRVIFLDVSRSRYSALPPSASSAFKRLAERGGFGLDEDEIALRMLVNDGILAEADEADRNLVPVSVTPARADLQAASCPVFHLSHVALALLWEARLALELRGRSLSSVLARVAERPRTPARMGSEIDKQIAAISAAFEHTALLLGKTDRCLVRSLALVSILRSRGIAARLVIGVRSRPFGAHAWVQREFTVLNDSVEHVSRYTPILAPA